MPPELIALLAQSAGQGLSGILSGLVGAGQRREGRRLRQQAEGEFGKVSSIAERLAGTGLPSEQYNQAMRNIQRQQLFAMKNAYDRRSGLAMLPAIQEGTNTATQNLDVANAQARTANLRQLQELYNQKYLRDYQYAMGLMGAGNQNLFGGIDKLAAGGIGTGLTLSQYGASGGGNGGNEVDYSQYFPDARSKNVL